MYLFNFLYQKVVFALLYYGGDDVSTLYKFLRLLTFVLTSFIVVIPFFCMSNNNVEIANAHGVISLLVCGLSLFVSVGFTLFMKKKKYVQN